MATAVRPPSAAEQRFQQLATAALNITHAAWPGSSRGRGDVVPAYSNAATLDASEDVRRSIQESGKQFGCHQCGTHVKNDIEQPWECDHVPPSGLPDSVLEALERDGYISDQWRTTGRVLLPACDECQRRQAVLVKALKHAPQDIKGIVERYSDEWGGLEVQRMFGGGRQRRAAFDSHGRRTTATERTQVQWEGGNTGCHICRTKIPTRVYIADHCPPKEFGTHYMQEVCRIVGVSLPAFKFRPHCPRCSKAQGPTIAVLKAAAKPICAQYNIPFPE